MYTLLCHPEELGIERCGDQATAFDSDGEVLFNCPAEWCDEIIRRILLIANTAFDKGYRAGQSAKMAELRRSLGVHEE